MQKFGDLEQKEIDRLKAKHGNVYQIIAKDEDGNEHYAYVTKPDLPIIQAAAATISKDPVKASIMIYKSVKLSASEAIESDAELKIAVINKVGEIFKIREANIKKL